MGLLRAAHPLRRPLVGKLDATADGEARVLRVDAVYEDVAFNKTMAVAVNGEIKDLACWLHLDARLPRRP